MEQLRNPNMRDDCLPVCSSVVRFAAMWIANSKFAKFKYDELQLDRRSQPGRLFQVRHVKFLKPLDLSHVVGGAELLVY